jgi:tRNA (uracil-5-)-methyltransferase TRM9
MNLIEERYVYNTYSNISKQFSSTRYSHWKGVKEYIYKIQELNKSNQINFLDYGCGNGKYLSLCKSFNTIAFDNCINLLDIVKTNFPYIQTIQGDVSIKNNILLNNFDSIICIAVIHHLSSKIRRIEAIKNIITYLKPNGTALISVWATTLDTSKYIKLETINDYLIGWNNEFNRYYHLFEKNELENLIKETGYSMHIKIINIFFEMNNWFFEIQKIEN